MTGIPEEHIRLPHKMVIHRHINGNFWHWAGYTSLLLDLVGAKEKGCMEQLLLYLPLGKSDRVLIESCLCARLQKTRLGWYEA